MDDIATNRPGRALAFPALVVATTLTLSGFGLPPVAGGTPVAAAASCAKFIESNIRGIAADLAYGPQNRLWISEGGLSQPLLRGLSPSGGADVTYALGDPDANGTGDPQGIAVGADGRLWIAGGALGQRIAAIDPSNGALVSFPLAGSPMRIASGADEKRRTLHRPLPIRHISLGERFRVQAEAFHIRHDPHNFRPGRLARGPRVRFRPGDLPLPPASTERDGRADPRTGA